MCLPGKYKVMSLIPWYHPPHTHTQKKKSTFVTKLTLLASDSTLPSLDFPKINVLTQGHLLYPWPLSLHCLVLMLFFPAASGTSGFSCAASFSVSWSHRELWLLNCVVFKEQNFQFFWFLKITLAAKSLRLGFKRSCSSICFLHLNLV